MIANKFMSELSFVECRPTGRLNITALLQSVYCWCLKRAPNRALGRVKSYCLVVLAVVMKIRYLIVRHALRSASLHRKLNVFFVIGDECKWKAQRLYDIMLKSDMYDPYVFVTKMDVGWIDEKLQVDRVTRCMTFFKEKGVRVLRGVDAVAEETLALTEFSPDIVIYQQPWGICSNQNPIAVSSRALTFYLPYWLTGINISTWSMHDAPLFRILYGTFVESAEYLELLRAGEGRFHNGVKYFVSRYPFSDEILDGVTGVHEGDSVIYAPHWGFVHPQNTGTDGRSTFLDTGRKILKYAVEHKDIHWIFKPHPMLKIKLIQSKVWTENEVEEYYSLWEHIGEAYYSGDYLHLFYKSRAMITDCDSFLTEYLLCDKPLIRLETGRFQASCKYEELKLSAMYRVSELNQLIPTLKLIIEDKKDPLSNLRKDVLVKMGYTEGNNSENLLAILSQECSHDGK